MLNMRAPALDESCGRSASHTASVPLHTVVGHLGCLAVLREPSAGRTVTLFPDDYGSDFTGMLINVPKREFLQQ